jgi:hypothetical protein
VYRGIELVTGWEGFSTTIGDLNIITTIIEGLTAVAGGGAGAGAGGATPAPVITIEPEAPPLAAIPEDEVPLAAPSDVDAGGGTTIEPERVPLANTASGWSLLSLIFVAAGLAFAVISFIAAAGRREEKATARVTALRIISLAVGVVTLLFWLLMDNFSGYVHFVNGNTLVVGILFAATIVVSVISNAFEKKKEEVDSLAL